MAVANAPLKNPLESPLAKKPRSISVLGSTGSIGCNTVNLLESNRDTFRVEALTAGNNWKLLAEQAIKLGASVAVINDEGAYDDLKNALSGTKIKACAGEAAG